jgi:putative oxidoreductase
MESNMKFVTPLGRLLMCSIFLWSGIGKIGGFSAQAGYAAAHGLPLPSLAIVIAIIIEIVGGLAILVGFKTRWAALVLAIYCLITGFVFHLPGGMAHAVDGSPEGYAALGDMINFYKNLVMAGGFLFVFTYGAGALSVDNRAAA